MDLKISTVDTAAVPLAQLQDIARNTHSEIERIIAARTQGYDTQYSSINLPADTGMRATIQEVIAQHQQRNPAALIVIGIGGSCLGTMAVHEMLYGRRYNERHDQMRVYYVDTIDADMLHETISIVESFLKVGRYVVINAISKSGTTTETVVNFELFYDLLKRYQPTEYKKSIVITTDEGSKLWEFAQAEGITALAIPKLVGGRYSVLSAVGLFPLGLIGVDIDALCAGAHEAVEANTSFILENNYALQRAGVLYAQYRAGKHIHDSFMFMTDAASLGAWYRQLMGESVGKEYDRDGNQVRIGITPTVSMGSVDLHSVGQLYLGGPRDKVTTFVAVAQDNHIVRMPDYPAFEKLVAKIQKKSIFSIFTALLHGVQIAYKNEGLPFMTIILPKKDAHAVGKIMQMQMLEIMYLGYMFNIDPFDQPQVELYKKETRKILAHE